MTRTVTLFTGQWADLPLEKLAEKVSSWGFDGLELACSSNHFDVRRALTEPNYTQSRWDILKRYNLKCFALANHLVGQAVCDPIDARHRKILPPYVWGDGEPEGVRRRAAQEIMDTARAAAKFGVTQVNGFSGSRIWHLLYSFPPNDFAEIEKGYEDFARRWNPIIDVFEREGVKFGLEVHPTEIAYDFVTTRKALDAIGNRSGFGINFGEARRGWDFVSPGHGDVDFESIFRTLNRIGYSGPLSIEWEDWGIDREWGAQDALAFVRRTDFTPSTVAFDAAFSSEKKTDSAVRSYWAWRKTMIIRAWREVRVTKSDL